MAIHRENTVVFSVAGEEEDVVFSVASFVRKKKIVAGEKVAVLSV